MKSTIIKTDTGYYPVLDDGENYYSLKKAHRRSRTPLGASLTSNPSPTLEAARRRITRAGLTWKPEPLEKITAWAAAKLAGVSYTTIIRWVGRGYLEPATTYPDTVTFSREAVLACAKKMKAKAKK